MLRSFQAIAISTIFLLLNSAASAYVVIESIDAGDSALDVSTAGPNGSGEKATGEVDELQSGELSGSLSFQTPNTRSSDNRKGSKGRQSAGNRARYPRPNVSGSGGGGGGGGGRGNQRRSNRNRDIEQTIVSAEENDVDVIEDEQTEDEGTDLTIYDEESSAGGAGGGSGGGGGSFDDEEEDDDDGTSVLQSGPSITGTPEPSALAIWVIAGCCGLGAVRFRNFLRTA